MKRILILGLVLILVCSGCAWFRTTEEKSAPELAGDGMDQFAGGKYRDAIESFEKLKDWYPFSKYAILAELKIADAYYHLEEYEEAIFAYEEFENLHPRNEAIPYVIYQMGRCYFEQLDTIDRDQTAAKKGLDIFQRLVTQFADTSYANKAGEHIKKCQQSLAGHEFYVGVFYYKKKHYKAALERFKTVISEYPDVGVHHEALEYIAQCEASIEKQAEN
jgi:outer membrane protein assembly factor BamD